MVLTFALRPFEIRVWPITTDNVETAIARTSPWYQLDENGRDERFFAVCPFCNNVIQIKGLYKNSGRQPPYGSHLGQAKPEIAPFRPLALQTCPTLAKPGLKPSDRRAAGELDRPILALIRSQFDRMILILREDFGVNFSAKAAERLLDDFLSARGWLYSGIHLHNLPWMLAYLARPLNLYGQFLRIGSVEGEGLVQALRTSVVGAILTPEGQLRSSGPRFSLRLQLLHHKRLPLKSNNFEEAITLRILDFSATNTPADAPTLLRRKLIIDPLRLTSLIHAKQNTRRNDQLLAIAERLIPKEWTQ